MPEINKQVWKEGYEVGVKDRDKKVVNPYLENSENYWSWIAGVVAGMRKRSEMKCSNFGK